MKQHLLKHPCDESRVGHLQKLAWSIQLFSDCFLKEQSVCMSLRVGERERVRMCARLREGILPLLLWTEPP